MGLSRFRNSESVEMMRRGSPSLDSGYSPYRNPSFKRRARNSYRGPFQTFQSFHRCAHNGDRSVPARQEFEQFSKGGKPELANAALRFFGDDLPILPDVNGGAVHAGGLARCLGRAAQGAASGVGEFFAGL